MTCLLEIDVSAIRANYDYLSQETSSRVSGVVKADAYGLGAIKVASVLIECGCKEFFVAEDPLPMESYIKNVFD